MSTRAKRRADLLSEVEYAHLLASQGGVCAICGNPPKTRRLDTDHDHRTGRVRGLLCHRCNRALPAWVTPQWLSSAAAYLMHGETWVTSGSEVDAFAKAYPEEAAEVARLTQDAC